MDTNIHTRALLVWLSISTWSARKYDKAVTAKVTRDYKAPSNAARVNKVLFPGDAPEYKELMTECSAIRVEHYGHTLAWTDGGYRLLPTANYNDYTAWYRNAQTRIDNKLACYLTAYPTLVQTAQTLLPTDPVTGLSLFNAGDYPSVGDMRKRFRISVEYAPVPAQGDIRVDLAADQIDSIEAAIVARNDAAVRTAMDDAWQRLYKVVSHIAERLTDPEAIFRDSLIGNAREVCNSLSRLNVANDPTLDAMTARVMAELTKYEPDTLRENRYARERTAEKANAIVSAMSGLYNVA